MYLDQKKTLELVDKYKNRFKKFTTVKTVLCPSYPYLPEAAKKLAKTNIRIGAQDVAAQDKGAFTGEVSAVMLREIGCRYALVGHSERRKMGEPEDQIQMKLIQCYHNSVKPVLCIGETEEDKINGQRDAVLAKQLRNAIAKVDAFPENELIIAYEPVWAIGTGQTMPAEEMYTVARMIKKDVISLYSEKFYNENVTLLYGGSINSIVAKEFWNIDVVGGLLVGGASLDIEEAYNIALQA